jgi:asparagine synthase (glutamine-hydrolysing)
MCGILGFSNIDVEQKQIDSALFCLKHRGPDAYGLWRNSASCLGHRRLSIIDLSDEAKQPFHNEDMTIHLVANGEIYNYNEIRNVLIGRGHIFKSCSDSEVLLHGYEEWGVDKLLSRINGMFAFAIFDEALNKLIVVRDRIGIKPMYYWYNRNEIAFASEIGALKKIIPDRLEIDEYARDSYFTFGYLPGNLSIYKNCNKLLPGHYFQFEKGMLTINKYWQPLVSGKSENFQIDDIQQLIENSVEKRMISDKPLGTFLSGGVDSSLITAIARNKKDKLKTFSIGFDYVACDESRYAKKIAEYLETEHTELFCSENDALKIVPKIPTVFGEPFSDISSIPTYLLSELTSKHVTVALSGDGGDELALGYNHYNKILLMSYFLKVPFRKTIFSNLAKLSHDNSILAKLGRLSECQSYSELCLFVSAIYKAKYFESLFNRPFDISRSYWKKLADNVKKMPADEALANIEFNHYMTEDILAKVDRTSMQHALEVRVPLLDHNVVDAILLLPRNMKYRNGTSKWILKEILKKYIPENLWKRPKQGFLPPMNDWLKGPLNQMMHDYLSYDSLQKEGIFNSKFIRKMIYDHENNIKDNQHYLWTMLVWKLWLENEKENC